MKKLRKTVGVILSLIMLFSAFPIAPVEVSAANKNMLIVDEVEHGTVKIVSGSDNVPACAPHPTTGTR